METFKEYTFGSGSTGSYKPMASLGDIAGKSYYGGLNASVERKITQTDLDQVEKYADRLFSALGIGVEFTKHFMNRVNDARNVKQITVSELIRLFKQAFRRYGKKIVDLPDQANGVINDMKTDINMPFVMNANPKGEVELIAKTIIRKKNFATSGFKLSFEQFRLDEAKAPDIKKGDYIIVSISKRPYKMGGMVDPKTILPAKSDKMYVHSIRKTKDGRNAHLRYDPKSMGGYAINLDKMPDFLSVKIAENINEMTTGEFAPVAHEKSLSELIFKKADLSSLPGSVANNMWLPLSGSMFNRIMPKEVRATVFHVTRFSNFDQLYTIQNTRRSISAFTNMNRAAITGGIQGGSGLVVELEGNILASAKEDLMSIPERSGRRMIGFKWFSSLGSSGDVTKMQKALERLLKSLVRKYGQAFDDKPREGKDDWEKWSSIYFAYVMARTITKGYGVGSKAAGRIMQKVIKDYLDGVERVLKQNAKQVQNILTNYMTHRKTVNNWDEIIVDDFNIKKVWIISDSNELHWGGDEEFKSNISLTKIPVEIIDAQSMESHVREVANKVTQG